ncbi:MAG: hypothetical protein O8C67_09380 [Candidatus Methanoperedens sp.]|nr:hypothetical protein [Candidatus Methanoperedens sp.]
MRLRLHAAHRCETSPHLRLRPCAGGDSPALKPGARSREEAHRRINIVTKMRLSFVNFAMKSATHISLY